MLRKRLVKKVKRKISITAVSTDNIEGILQKLGIYDEVMNKKIKCFICGKTLTINNIGGILMVDNKPVLVCDKPSCIAKAALLSKKYSLTSYSH